MKKKNGLKLKWFCSLAIGLVLMGASLHSSWFKKPTIQLKNVDFKNLNSESLELKLTLSISNQNSLNCRYLIKKVVLYDEKGREIGFIKKTAYTTLKAKKKQELSVETSIKTDQAIKTIFDLLTQKELHFKMKGKIVVNTFWFLFFKVSFKEDFTIDPGEIF